MRKKLLTLLFALCAVLCCAFGLVACNGKSKKGGSDPIDYTKYEYYGNYSFGGATPAGYINLDLQLDTNSQYTMELSVNTFTAIYTLTEVGEYTMHTFEEPVADQTLQAIYAIRFSPVWTSGYDGSVINTSSGYITQNYFSSFWWCYCDTVQYGATILLGNANATYVMDYSKLKYRVNYLAETGGSISGVASQSVPRGEDGMVVTAVADYGYRFNGWSDGLTSATRKESEVCANMEITATFVEDLPKYTLTYTCTEGGTLQGECVQTLFEGLDGSTVKAIPSRDDSRYQFIEWSDGVTTAERTDLNVSQNLNVTAIFKPQFYYYASVVEGGGSVEVSAHIANHANEYTVSATATPNEGWAFLEWTDGVQTAIRTDVLTEDTSVKAIFAKEIILIAKEGGTITYNGQTGTQITALVRLPLIGELPPSAQSIADEGYSIVGWSIYEDGHFLWSYSSHLYLEYYSRYYIYYAIFEKDDD